jgi:hypothetical protein
LEKLQAQDDDQSVLEKRKEFAAQALNLARWKL